MSNKRTTAAQQKLLPTIIDELARDKPDNVWAEYPASSTTFSDGFKQITYLQFANAVNGCAHRIEKALGKKDTGESLVWLGPNDPRCAITLVATMKAGFNLFLVSERNSVAANHKLFDDVKCSTLVTTSTLFPPVQATLSGRDLRVIELPPLEQLLHEPQAHYHYSKDLKTSHDEIAFMVHTSGSTGFPKPSPIFHSFVSRMAQNISLPAPEGYEMQNAMISNNKGVLLLPLGHPAGVNFGILNAFFNNATVILPLPNVPPTGEALVQILKHTRADWAALAPLTLETISKHLSLLDEIVCHLKMLLFSGGSLPKVFGDVISTKIKLLSSIGSSETGPLPTMYRHGYDFKNDWNYLQFPPDIGASFDPLPGEVYELVFKKTSETEPYQPVFINYPLLNEHRTKDLFTPHPSLPGLWTHASRSDDVIVFINGEKVNPIDFESHVCKHPEVSAALMFGKQRFEAGLLIELSENKPLSTAERAQVINRLWPTIEEANHILPAYAQVSQTHICFTDPNIPVQRTLKGTIRRKVTLEQYEEKINKLYADIEAMWTPVSNQPKPGTVDSLKEIVRESLRCSTKLGEIEETDDFFQRGLDSLQVLRLVRTLRVKSGLGSIQPSTVYLHPSIPALAGTLHQLANQGESLDKQRKEQQKNIRSSILQKYMEKIDNIATSVTKSVTAQPSVDSHNEGQVVILTGSTGSIGSYILRSLLEQPEIAHVYCLNRSPTSATVQKERNAESDPTLPSSFPENKVTFLTANLTETSTLGLSPLVFNTLRKEATLVIHNAWAVNFNIPLQSFEPLLDGIVNLSAFCANSTRQAVLLFISSISAVMGLDTAAGPVNVPEAIITYVQAAADAGYAESKYIGERLIAHASKNLGLHNSTILRLGQIAGAARGPGRWNSADWIPALVQGSRYLGVVPDSLDSVGASDDDDKEDIDWLPIDRLADVVIEIGLKATVTHEVAPGVEPVTVLHLLNPNRTSWKALLPSVTSTLEAAFVRKQEEPVTPIQIASPDIWLAKLRANVTASMGGGVSEQAREALLDANPALRLIDFFNMRFGGDRKGAIGKLVWETSKAVKASEKLRCSEVIDSTMMERWIKQWLTKG